MDDLNHSSGSLRLIDSESHQMHFHRNATQITFPKERYVHQLTASQAEHIQLTESPLLRARLLRLDREAHLLLLSIHHIVLDDWSLELSLREPRPGYLMTLAHLKRQLNTMSDDEIQEALRRKRLQRSI